MNLSDQDGLLQQAIDCLRTKHNYSDAELTKIIGYSGKSGPRDLERFVSGRSKEMDNKRDRFWKKYFNVLRPIQMAGGESESGSSLLIRESEAFTRKLSSELYSKTDWSVGNCDDARPCPVCLYPVRNYDALKQHAEKMHAPVTSAAAPKVDATPAAPAAPVHSAVMNHVTKMHAAEAPASPKMETAPNSLEVTLNGVSKLFAKAATRESNAELVQLLQLSAHHLDVSINIIATTDGPDTFKVSGQDPAAVTRFVDGLTKLWDSHTKGVAAVESTVTIDQDDLLQVAIECLRNEADTTVADIRTSIGYKTERGDLQTFVDKTALDMVGKRRAFWKLYFAKMTQLFRTGTSDAALLIKKRPTYTHLLNDREFDDLINGSHQVRSPNQARPCPCCFFPAHNHADLITHAEMQHTKVVKRSSAALPKLKRFTSKMFVNFEEPVVDVGAVVVLYNPVDSNLDQRQSLTISSYFWNRFKDAGGDRAAWESRVVFLDLVPLLDSGKQKGGADEKTNLVAEATKECIFTQYVMTRIEHYVAQAKQNTTLPPQKLFPVILCSGHSDTAAVKDFKLSVEAASDRIAFYDGVCHPVAPIPANDSHPITVALRKFLEHFGEMNFSAES